MSRRHRRERRRLLVAAAVIVCVATACSGSGDRASPPPTDAPAPSSTTASSTTSTTFPPTITSTPVAGVTGVIGFVTSVHGRGPATVELPASVGRPAMVHAQYDGTDSFVVRAVDAQGRGDSTSPTRNSRTR